MMDLGINVWCIRYLLKGTDDSSCNTTLPLPTIFMIFIMANNLSFGCVDQSMLL